MIKCSTPVVFDSSAFHWRKQRTLWRFFTHVLSHLCVEGLALCCGRVGIGGDGGAGVDVICVDVVANAAAYRAAVIPAATHARGDGELPFSPLLSKQWMKEST